MKAAPGWDKLRSQVYDRDGGKCKVCGIDLRISVYECGHKVDRCAGGKDELDNLDAMCIICNRAKPVHDTLEQYRDWKEGMIPWAFIGKKTMDEVMRDILGGDTGVVDVNTAEKIGELLAFQYYSFLTLFAMPEMENGTIKWVGKAS